MTELDNGWRATTARIVGDYVLELVLNGATANREGLPGAALAGVRHKQDLLLGKMEALGVELCAEASLVMLTADVVKTSAIEGEALNADEVRSSLARRLKALSLKKS